MKLTIKDSGKPIAATDLLAVVTLEKKTALPAGIGVPPLARTAFKGEFREARLTDAIDGAAKRVLQVGLGKRAEADTERVRRAGAIAAHKAEKVRAASLAVWVSPDVEEAVGGPEACAQALVEGALLGGYAFADLKSKKEGPYLKSVAVHGSGAAFRRGAGRGRIVAEANCFTRRLQDTPGNLMRPRDLVAEAKRIARRDERISVRALDESAMKRLGMGSLLSVSRGSEEPAYLIHLVYRPRAKARRKVCLVGKGLTFDAGGISLKPSKKMDEMKYDMSGGAAVLGVFHALAGLKPAVEVHGLVPTSENLPDGRANKPGDLVEAMNGLTIEVLNTDAEGRLILCDALAYAVQKVKPEVMIDLATLTGAVVTALGHELTGAMGNDEKLIDALVASGKATGELVWPLPLLECHKKQMKGAVGDLRNINDGQGAGSSAGGAFLSHFVGETRWAHLDIAGSAWGAEDRDYQGGAQGTGVGVRLLTHYLQHGL